MTVEMAGSEMLFGSFICFDAAQMKLDEWESEMFTLMSFHCSFSLETATFNWKAVVSFEPIPDVK